MVEASQRVDIEANGLPAGMAFSNGYALARFGDLHLNLLTKATADIVTDTFWSIGASVAGNAGFFDIVTPQLPGSPIGTEVLVQISLNVTAALTDERANAYVESTATLQTAEAKIAEIHFQNASSKTPATYQAIRFLPTPAEIRFGESTITVKLTTGTSYMLGAGLQGDTSALADITPGMDPSTHVHFSQATVNALNSAHIGLEPLTPGLQLITASKATYPSPSTPPTLWASNSADGPFEPVTSADVSTDTHEISVPLSATPRFYRLSSSAAVEIKSIRIQSSQVILGY